MKKLFFLCVFALAGVFAFAQESKQDLTKLPPVMVRDARGLEMIPYAVLENGSYVPKSRKEIRNLLLSVKGNEYYVKHADALYAGVWTGLGVGMAGITVSVLSAFVPAMQNNVAVDTVGTLATVFGLAGSSLCGVFYSTKIAKAAENYNISVMGFPILAK